MINKFLKNAVNKQVTTNTYNLLSRVYLMTLGGGRLTLSIDYQYLS